jgi:TPR repeat protein
MNTRAILLALIYFNSLNSNATGLCINQVSSEYDAHKLEVRTIKKSNEVMDCYFKASTEGDAEATFKLALFFLKGNENTIPDKAKGIKYMIRAADQGSTEAAYYSGAILLAGIKTVRVKEKNIIYKYLKMAADKGHVVSSHTLGLFLLGLNDSKEKNLEGINWLTLAAESGNKESMHYLGLVYITGTDFIAKNGALSALWLHKSEDNGHIESANNLGIGYLFGQFGAVDISKSEIYLLKAAEYGIAEAQFYLGSLYYDKKEYGFKEAGVVWLRKSLQNGFEDAKPLLDKIDASNTSNGSNGSN